MDAKKFVLSYYKNATRNFHITRITAPQEALNLHSHNYFQIYYVIHGTIIHHIKNSSAKLTSGDVFILPPNLPHYIEVPEGNADFYSMSFTPDFFQNGKESNKLILDFLYYLKTETAKNIQPKITLIYEDSVFVEVLLKRIIEEFLDKKTGKNEIIKESVSVVLSVFARVYFEETAETLHTEENKQQVMYCVDYIRNHFEEDITLTEIVHLSAMSKTCFCSIFTAITGTSFKEYLNRYRIERAAELIASGEKISVAGSRCGYSDFSTFYRNFKKYMGMSPSELANKNRMLLFEVPHHLEKEP